MPLNKNPNGTQRKINIVGFHKLGTKTVQKENLKWRKKCGSKEKRLLNILISHLIIYQL